MARRDDKGYIIPAINTADTDYVACAIRLAESIRDYHPTAKICLLTDVKIENKLFNYVNILPHGDADKDSTWKLSNDWQVFSASPFRQTIKLEADMIAASPIDHWWALFEHRDVVISQGCRDIYDQYSDCRFYRKFFDQNDLADVYNGVVYWRLSNTAQEFFMLVKNIFTNWDDYKKLLKFPESIATTDAVYAVAAEIIGREQVTLPTGLGPSIVHMKRGIIPTQTNDWTKELVWENINPGLRLQTVAQWGFVHYHIKDWKM